MWCYLHRRFSRRRHSSSTSFRQNHFSHGVRARERPTFCRFIEILREDLFDPWRRGRLSRDPALSLVARDQLVALPCRSVPCLAAYNAAKADHRTGLIPIRSTNNPDRKSHLRIIIGTTASAVRNARHGYMQAGRDPVRMPLPPCRRPSAWLPTREFLHSKNVTAPKTTNRG